MSKSKVTIKDLSEYCNVSTATISRVINNNGRFSEETRMRVMDAIQKLGYIPNASAKMLRTRTSRLVGIFVSDLEYEMTASTVSKLQQHLFEQGYASIICNIGSNADKEEEYYQMMLSLNVRGIIAIIRSVSTIYKHTDIPIIYIYKNPIPLLDNKMTCVIATDDFEAGYIAGSELIRLGCKRIAEVRLKSMDNRIPLGRHLGLLQSLYDHNVPYDESLSIVTETNKFDEIYQTINETLSKHGAADGYFCVSDLLALALIRSLESHNYHIPEDVKVIGCNDMSLAMYNNKPITTIRHRIDDICLAAIDNLNRMLAGEELTNEQRKQTFGVSLVQRKTT